MDEEPDPVEGRAAPFPGNFFWRSVEWVMSAVGLGSPRNIFKVRQARARWEERHAASANIARGVAYTHKTCPACGRLVERRAGRCSYCGANVRWAPGPGLARTLGLAIPHGSVAMTLVTLNILFYAVSSLVTARSSGGSLLTALFQPDVRSLYNLGGLVAPSVLYGEIWRLWTYQFLHAGALHIFFNLYALLSLGPATEDVYGPSKTAALYWATGTAAGVTTFGVRVALFLAGGGQLTFEDMAGRFPITIGASGAIFGLIGVLIGHSFRRGGSHGANLREFLVRWAVYGLVMGFFLGADNAAHIGGLAAGFVLGLVVPGGEPRSGPGAIFWRLAALAAAGLTVYGFVAAAMAPHMGA